MSHIENRHWPRSDRRQFVRDMAGSLAGALIARALPWGTAATTLLWTPRLYASTVLDPSNPIASFQQEGGGTFHIEGDVLTLEDTSKSDFVVLFALDNDAASGKDLDLVATFRITGGVPVNADAGNRIVINDGVAKAAIAECVQFNHEVGITRGIGLYSSGFPYDPASYPVFVPVDWSAGPVTVRLRRMANGDAEIIEVNGVAPSPRAVLTADKAPSNTRNGATVEFGCASTEAECTVEYSAFRSERVVLPVGGSLSFTRFRIRDTDTSDRLALRADYQLGAGSSGLDPSTEPVTIQLATPGCCAFYQQTLNGFTVQGKAPRRRWALTDAERARTGIEQCLIDENRNNTGAIVLRDARTALDDAYFGAVTVAITIGTGSTADRLIGTATLNERLPGSGRWRLDRES